MSRHSKRTNVSKMEVANFKKHFCNENRLITTLIKDRFHKYFMEPILDVGSGIGDIISEALPQKEVICIDKNELSEEEIAKLPEKHEWVTTDFFDFVPERKINTVFIAHTLQFLDSDIGKLNQMLHILNPKYLISVTNENQDFMGKLVDWSLRNYDNANPEVRHSDFPDKTFTLLERERFKAKISATTFEALAEQASYLTVIDLDSNDLKLFLKKALKEPSFEFFQLFEVYVRNER